VCWELQPPFDNSFLPGKISAHRLKDRLFVLLPFPHEFLFKFPGKKPNFPGSERGRKGAGILKPPHVAVITGACHGIIGHCDLVHPQDGGGWRGIVQKNVTAEVRLRSVFAALFMVAGVYYIEVVYGTGTI
jgi:hypothetical protein